MEGNSEGKNGNKLGTQSYISYKLKTRYLSDEAVISYQISGVYQMSNKAIFCFMVSFGIHDKIIDS